MLNLLVNFIENLELYKIYRNEPFLFKIYEFLLDSITKLLSLIVSKSKALYDIIKSILYTFNAWLLIKII